MKEIPLLDKYYLLPISLPPPPPPSPTFFLFLSSHGSFGLPRQLALFSKNSVISYIEKAHAREPKRIPLGPETVSI